jgi:adenosine kinase
MLAVCLTLDESSHIDFVEFPLFQTKDIPTIAAKLAALPKKNASRPRTVVITQGPLSTVVVEGSSAPKTFPVNKLSEDQIVDTNGAGDAFAGAFVGATVLGKSVAEAVEAGHKLGQICVGQIGPQFKWPKVDIL